MNRFEMIAPLGSNLKYFVKWTVISCLIGAAGGLAGTLFGSAVWCVYPNGRPVGAPRAVSQTSYAPPQGTTAGSGPG